MLHDCFAFMRPTPRLLAADGRGGAGVDCEFKVQNRELDAGSTKTVPAQLDDVDDGGADFRRNIEADDEVLVKFG